MSSYAGPGGWVSVKCLWSRTRLRGNESGRRAGNEVGGDHRRGPDAVSPVRSDTLFDHKGDLTPACLACFTSQSELPSPPSY